MARIIAFQACRHGTGCSHLVANLAVLLVQQGYRVGLLDTDPRGAGLRTIFSLDNTDERRLDRYWWFSLAPTAPDRLTRQAYNYGTRSPYPQQPGFYIAPVGQRFGADSQQLNQLQRHYQVATAGEALRVLCDDLNLQYLLLDIQPELGEDELLGLALADTVVLMMQLDKYDFQRAAVLLEVLVKLATQQVWLVPGLVPPEISAESVQQKLETIYHQPVAGVLHMQEAMVALASRGVFCLHEPQHALTEAMQAIATQICATPQQVRPAANPDRAAGRLGRSRQRPLFGILELPPLQRQILTTVIRQGTLTQSELQAQSHALPEDVATAVAQLIEQGWLVQDPQTQRMSYQSQTSPEQSKLS